MPSLHRKIGLGTAQFGMAYGVTNRSGQVNRHELDEIMAMAARYGIDVFDTAPAYDQSEKVLGHYTSTREGLRIVTKTPHFKAPETTDSDVELLQSTFAQSLKSLQVDSVHALLLHGGANLLRPNSSIIWAALEALKSEMKVGRIGVSVYTPDELKGILDLFPVDIVQVPANILDQRFSKSGLLKQLREAGVEIHVRSAFLQGVLLSEPHTLGEFFDPLKPHLLSLRQTATDAGMSMLQMALNYVLHMDETGTALVGVDSAAQFQEILDSVDDDFQVDTDWQRWAVNDTCWINPGEWKL